MKQKKRLFILATNMMLALLLSINVFAQQVITGTLKGPTGAPLVGATVIVKGTTNATTTDARGAFSLPAPIGSTLVISSVGYKEREVIVTGATLNETLDSNESTLGDVVVIGYQTVRKKDLTGATGVVNMTDAAKVTGGSAVESIQGLVPGVTVRNGGAPGQNSAIEIRGVASFLTAAPLYVIDGMLSDANTTINNNDIASIQILKDASAAAIYGSRAANGVVIITTKKGRSGDPKISFSAKYGVQKIPKTWDVMGADQFVATQKLQYQNSGLPYPTGLDNPKFNTDWQDETYRTGSDQDYNLGISGGTAKSSFLLSGSYYKNQGVLIGNDFDRASLRINTEAKKGRLTIGENLVFSSTHGKNPGGGVNAFYEAPQMAPIIAVQDPSYATQQYNPAGWGFGTNETPNYASNYIANAALDKQTYSFAKIVGNAYADLKLTDWLSYRFNAGAEISFDTYKEVRDTGIWRYLNQPPSTSLTETRQRFTSFLLEHTLNFNKTFGKHNVNGVLGYSYQEFETENTTASRLGIKNVNGELFTTIHSAGGASSTDGNTFQYRIQGLLGRLNYNYDDKYLITLSGRSDEDSRFGPDYRHGNFYAVGAGWRISKEKFFDLDQINDLKIRGSYGRLGINTLSAYPYQGVVNSNPRAVYGTGQSPQTGTYQAVTTNPDLRWEKRDESNIGFDAQLLNNKISVTADVYKNVAKDVLLNVPIPGYSGSAGALPFANAGSIKNTGFEFAVAYHHTTGDIKWDVAVNGTTIKNEVLSVGNQGVGVTYLQTTNFIRSQIGNAMGSFYLIKTDGIFQSQSEVDNYKNAGGTVIQPNAKAGDIRYIDANGDGQINNDDRQFTGKAFPTFQAGLQINVAYKQLSLNVQFVGVFGNSIYNDIRRVLDSYQLTNFRTDISPWTPTNTNTKDPRLGVQTDPGINENNRAETDRWLEKGSYVRLRNVELAYTFQKNILSKIGFANSRVYISGQNLFTITKYKGLDPDVVGSGILARGFDNGNWPSSRRGSIGIQCDF